MKTCLVSVGASHYRYLIYKLMEDQLDCDFVFGQRPNTVKQLDYSSFKKATPSLITKLKVGKWYKMNNISNLTKSYDVIIDDMGILCTTSWINLMISKVRGQKVYLWSHGWYGREGVVKKWMKRAYSALSDGMFVYGNYARDLMVKNGFNPSKLHVIHNSLNYDAQITLRSNLRPKEIYKSHFGNSYPTLIFIGRLTKGKKLDLLLEAVAKLKKENKNYNIVLVGDGTERPLLESKAEELAIQKQTWFYGACYDENENANLIFNADLCVAPGNIGLTAMHAMMFGCPCLSHNDFPWQMPEFEAIQEGKTGLFFKRDDILSLAVSISKWFSKYAHKREVIRVNCYNEIDSNWNPYRQIETFKLVLNN